MPNAAEVGRTLQTMRRRLLAIGASWLRNLASSVFDDLGDVFCL